MKYIRLIFVDERNIKVVKQVVKVDIIKECQAKKTLQNIYAENEKTLSPGLFLFFKNKL